MKTPHLARVEAPPEAFAPLVAAARALGLRAGWLDLGLEVEPGAPLAAAADLGVLRAVAVGTGCTGLGRTVAVKPLAGAPVLKDLLREHFLGCALVLVRGASEASDPLLATAARLTPVAEGFRLEGAAPSPVALTLTAEALASRLRRPRLLPEE